MIQRLQLAGSIILLAALVAWLADETFNLIERVDNLESRVVMMRMALADKFVDKNYRNPPAPSGATTPAGADMPAKVGGIESLSQ